jgi:hypothetical protein
MQPSPRDVEPWVGCAVLAMVALLAFTAGLVMGSIEPRLLPL